MTTLTEDQRVAFSLSTGYWNGADNAGDADTYCVAEAHQAVQTHETLSDFTASRGRGQTIETPVGVLHYWPAVQMRKGAARGELFAMFFDGVAASFFTGQA